MKRPKVHRLPLNYMGAMTLDERMNAVPIACDTHTGNDVVWSCVTFEYLSGDPAWRIFQAVQTIDDGGQGVSVSTWFSDSRATALGRHRRNAAAIRFGLFGQTPVVDT